MQQPPNHEISPNPKPTIEVVYAGGTISSLATPEGHREGGHVVDLVGQLEYHMPGFGDTITLGEAAVAYTGLSENIDAGYWETIGNAVDLALSRSPRSVVVTHGTDSMEQTAGALQAKFAEQLRARQAKIILTGANEDISDPNTDAWDNLAFAFESASGDAEPGVYVAFHRKLIPADLVVKEPFNGRTMNYTSKYDPAYLEALEYQQNRTRELTRRLEAGYGRPPQEGGVIDYPVNVVRGDHQAFLDEIERQPVSAVLLTLYHSGTAHTEKPGQSVAELASRLHRERGITFFAVTENGETVNFGGYETSLRLREAGIVPLGNMLHGVALAKLKIIGTTLSADELKQEMLTNRAGELTY